MCFAQGGPPAAKVAVATVERGTLAPTSQLSGTVFFKELSLLATEVEGKVVEVLFEEGEHLKKDAPMVRLDSVLLIARLEAARALLSQSEAELALERSRFERAKMLLEDEVTTPQQYDDLRFTVESYEHRVSANRAEVERLLREIEKKTIGAPFPGIVVERQTELGEWKRSGDAIALFARDSVYDVIVNAPQSILQWIEPGALVGIDAAGQSFQGRTVTVIPRGDTVTQTFPVKIRVEGRDDLLEGMSALVSLPAGQETECLVIPRDAVLTEGGRTSVFVPRAAAAGDGQEGMPPGMLIGAEVPVTLFGYEGLYAGIEGDGLQEGMEVIVKGHERLRDGQAVEVIP
jgi:RND family efflux transporter MFP subunit